MEYKQAIIIRTDLGMGKGKIAAQAAHASVSSAEKSSYKRDWISEGQKKTVLKIGGEKDLLLIFEDAKRQGLSASLIEDAGLTQIEAGTKTAVGIGPAPEGEVDKITKNLKLL